MLQASNESRCSTLMGNTRSQVSSVSDEFESGSNDTRRVRSTALKALEYHEDYGVYLLQNQAAGHADIFFKVSPDSPLVFKAMFECELRFNRALFGLEQSAPWPDHDIDANTLATDLVSLRRFAPEFTGETKRLSTDDSFLAAVDFAALVDFTHGYAKPCVMDVKLGTSSVVVQHSLEKQASAKQKDSSYTTAKLGYRIQGFRRYDSNSCLLLKKEWQRKDLDEAEAQANAEAQLKLFLPKAPSNVSKVFFDKIQYLHEAMKKQRSFSFTGVSLVLMYEGKPDQPPRPKVYLIDFAEAAPYGKGAHGEREPDNGVAFGLNNIMQVFNSH